MKSRRYWWKQRWSRRNGGLESEVGEMVDILAITEWEVGEMVDWSRRSEKWWIAVGVGEMVEHYHKYGCSKIGG